MGKHGTGGWFWRLCLCVFLTVFVFLGLSEGAIGAFRRQCFMMDEYGLKLGVVSLVVLDVRGLERAVLDTSF